MTGDRFQAQGVPLLPGVLAAGADLKFSIRYSPTQQIETDSGLLTVGLSSKTIRVALSGSGVGSLFTYEILNGDIVTPFVPNATVSIPDTPVGVTSSIAIRVRNTGNADGQIPIIATAGTGLQIPDLPLLPLTLAPGSSVIFTLAFTPTQAGSVTGRLRIGNDLFNVSAVGSGVLLNFAYSTGSTATNVPPNTGVVIFSPVTLGLTTSATFTITNTGTAQATVNSIALTDPRSPFVLRGLPPLPVSIPPQGSSSFRIDFAPIVPGPVVETLRIDTQTFTLSGTGLSAGAVPSYSFQERNQRHGSTAAATAGLIDPFQALCVGLTGTLRITQISDTFSVDPSVQFSTGGSSINFTIPANSTAAVFSNNSTTIQVQTGSVAGKIVLTPSFTLSSGLDVSPDPSSATHLDNCCCQTANTQFSSVCKDAHEYHAAGKCACYGPDLGQNDLRLHVNFGRSTGQSGFGCFRPGKSVVWQPNRSEFRWSVFGECHIQSEQFVRPDEPCKSASGGLRCGDQ